VTEDGGQADKDRFGRHHRVAHPTPTFSSSAAAPDWRTAFVHSPAVPVVATAGRATSSRAHAHVEVRVGDGRKERVLQPRRGPLAGRAHFGATDAVDLPATASAAASAASSAGTIE
jgi:hypothetical protein